MLGRFKLLYLHQTTCGLSAPLLLRTVLVGMAKAWWVHGLLGEWLGYPISLLWCSLQPSPG